MNTLPQILRLKVDTSLMNTTRLLRCYWLPAVLLVIAYLISPVIARPILIPVTRITNQEPSLLAQQQIANHSALYSLMQNTRTGKRASIVGVYAPNHFSFPIVQQPADDTVFVSPEPGVVTQFASASSYGTVGLLAHNTLAGAAFFDLKIGDKVLLLYGDRGARPYTIQSIRQFQALDPTNPYSDFIDLQANNQRLNSKDLFKQIYSTGDRLVFQTCIDLDGQASWGRIFITATPDEKKSGPYWPDFWQIYSLY